MSSVDDEKDGVADLDAFESFLNISGPQEPEEKPDFDIDRVIEAGRRQSEDIPDDDTETNFSLPKMKNSNQSKSGISKAPNRDTKKRVPKAAASRYNVKPNSHGVDRKRVAIAGLVTLCIIGSGIYALSDSGSGSKKPVAQATTVKHEVPVAVPALYQTTYNWSGSTDTSLSPAVLPNGDVVTKTGNSFSIVDTKSNKTLYTSSGTTQLVSSAPFGTKQDSGFAWNNGNGTGGVWTSSSGYKNVSIPSSSQLYLTGASPFVFSSSSPDSVGIINTSTGVISKQKVSNGFTPMGILPGSSTVVAGNGNNTIEQDSGSAYKRVSLNFPGGLIARKWIGMTGNTIVVILDKKGDPSATRNVTVAFFNASTGKMISSSQAQWQYVANSVATCNQDFSKIAIGPVLFDGSKATTLTDQTVTVLSITSDMTYGISQGQRTGSISNDIFTPYSVTTAIPLGENQDGSAIIRVAGSVYAISKKL